MNHSIFMKHALKIAKDRQAHGYLPIGTVLVRKNKIIANNSFSKANKKTLTRIDHAEVIALQRLFQKDPDADLSDVTLYCTLEPCLMCYSTSIISGITKIVYAYEDAMGGGTNLNHKTLKPYYLEKSMSVTPNICRAESLVLFKKYFENPDNEYAGTLLERYTLQASIQGQTPCVPT